ncbi:MAG: hypothetical protein HKM89_15525 [Gemmatimonadales bacterium]|nr:hypothetical protein [Gemmatimonadales bacterium]
MRGRSPVWAIPLVTTAALLIARAVAAPAITDPTGAPLPEGLKLSTPWIHLVLAPLFTLWDGTSMLPMSRLKGLVTGLLLLYVLWRAIRFWSHRRLLREIGYAALALIGFLLFVLVGATWHRPMVALTSVPEDAAVADFHSHTNASHDVEGLMDGWDLGASRRWHRRAGFDAFFLTDHNTQSPAIGLAGEGVPYACEGIEISAWRAHMVLLGRVDSIDRRPYTTSLEGVLQLIEDASTQFDAISIASIPEYERYHWKNLELFVATGLDGFEIVNASPKANELSRVRRDSVIALARRTDRIVVGVSDQHGWGATSMVWNLVPLEDWRRRNQDPCPRILARLKTAGFDAVQVVERHRLRAEAWWPEWLTPVGLVWETWRGMGWPLTLGWLAWIWGWAIIVPLRRRNAGLASTRSGGPR